MRLDKLAKIREHRIFRDFTWPGELDPFGRFNLIYGWNGSGKTTLSGLVRSLQDSTAISEGQADFVFDGSKVAGSSLATASLPQVRVFNRDTVSRSVFESLGGSLEHLPPVYVFGEESADKQRQVDALKAQLPGLVSAASQAATKAETASTALNEYAVDKARQIKNLLVAPGGSFNNYNVANFRADISTFESKPSPALTDAQRQSLLSLKDAQPLPAIKLPSLSFPDVVQLQAEARVALAKTVVSNVISDLTENAPVADWIGTGLPLHTQGGDSAVCKFCEQPLAPARLRRLEAPEVLRNLIELIEDCDGEHAQRMRKAAAA